MLLAIEWYHEVLKFLAKITAS